MTSLRLIALLLFMLLFDDAGLFSCMFPCLYACVLEG